MRQNTLNKGNGASRRRSEAANECLQRALAEREAFLERFPHLRAYQAEIDRVLDMSGNSQGRMAVLATMMQASLMDLQTELDKLTKILKSAVKSE